MPRNPTAARTPKGGPSGPPRVRLSEHLERALRPFDRKMVKLPAIHAMRRGTISREAYVQLLQSLLVMHQAVEKALEGASHLKGLNQKVYHRGPALIRDLRNLGGKIPVRTSDALDEFDSSVRFWARPPCLSMVGAIYVFERERRLGPQAAPPLAKAMRRKLSSRSGLDYHLDGSSQASQRLTALGRMLDTRVKDMSRAKEVIQGAVLTMSTLVQVHKDLS